MKKNFFRICVVCFTVVLAGCLDDDKYALDPSGTENVLEFTDISVPISPLGAVHPAYLTAFSVKPVDSLIAIISYSGPNSNNKDIELTLSIDPLALEAYNTQQAGPTFTPYEVLPENLYEIASMTVTLPKGKTKLELPIEVYPSLFDLSKKYALPLRISSASTGTLSAVYSAALFGVVVKNRYDGIYTIGEDDGTMVDVTNAAFTGLYPKLVSLRTVDAHTNDYYDEDYALAGHIFFTGTGASYYGGFVARISFDPADNVIGAEKQVADVIAVANALGQGNNNRSGKLDPAQPARVADADDVEFAGSLHAPIFRFESDKQTPYIDPEGTVPTMELWYIMRQINTGVDRSFWKEKYFYVEPRP